MYTTMRLLTAAQKQGIALIVLLYIQDCGIYNPLTKFRPDLYEEK